MAAHADCRQGPVQGGLLDVLIRAGLVAALALSCFQILPPVPQLMLWSVILAITIYPLQRKLKVRMETRMVAAATLIVLVAILILVVPVGLLGVSITDSVQTAVATAKSGNVHIPPPAESVAGWPVVGKPLYEFWERGGHRPDRRGAAVAPQLKDVTLSLLGKLAGFGMGLMMFFGALIVAGIWMAYGESSERSAVRIASRIFAPGKGAKVAELCTATIRAVAQGVVGIAFIQMLLVGIGFAVMGVPGSGPARVGVLVCGIVQLPATLITLPVIGLVFLTEAHRGDHRVRHLHLRRGRGRQRAQAVAPGARRGRADAGDPDRRARRHGRQRHPRSVHRPVMLAIGYELFWQWVDDQPEEATPAGLETPPGRADATAVSTPPAA
jgi:predicted PurR-regulated permease PerM